MGLLGEEITADLLEVIGQVVDLVADLEAEVVLVVVGVDSAVAVRPEVGNSISGCPYGFNNFIYLD